LHLTTINTSINLDDASEFNHPAAQGLFVRELWRHSTNSNWRLEVGQFSTEFAKKRWVRLVRHRIDDCFRYMSMRLRR
jgi:hypothetical protein